MWGRRLRRVESTKEFIQLVLWWTDDRAKVRPCASATGNHKPQFKCSILYIISFKVASVFFFFANDHTMLFIFIFFFKGGFSDLVQQAASFCYGQQDWQVACALLRFVPARWHSPRWVWSHLERKAKKSLFSFSLSLSFSLFLSLWPYISSKTTEERWATAWERAVSRACMPVGCPQMASTPAGRCLCTNCPLLHHLLLHLLHLHLLLHLLLGSPLWESVCLGSVSGPSCECHVPCGLLSHHHHIIMCCSDVFFLKCVT